MMRKRPKENLNGELLFYDDPFPWDSHKFPDRKYWTAVQVAEDCLGRIHTIQNDRKDEEGDIESILLDDEIRVLRAAMVLLGDSMKVIEHLRDPDAGPLPGELNDKVKKWSNGMYITVLEV